MALAAAVLSDVSYPETPIALKDLHLVGNQSVQALRASAQKRIRFSHYKLSSLAFSFNIRTTNFSLGLFRSLTFHNSSMSDESAIGFLEVMDGVPVSYIHLEDVVLTGEGR